MPAEAPVISATGFMPGCPARWLAGIRARFGILAADAAAQRDPLLRRHAKEIGGAPQQIVLQLVAAAVGIDDLPHHLDDAGAAALVERAVERMGEMIKVDRFLLGRRRLGDQFFGRRIVERKALLEHVVQLVALARP